MSLIIALALLQSTASVTGDDVIVRGKRTAAALAACVERKCRTEDDVRVSIAHAESQFAEGKYREARITLQQAIERNRDAAARLPRHVAALHEAYSNVSLHYGDLEDHRRAVGRQARILRAGLPDGATDVQLLAIQLGDARLKQRDMLGAIRQYRSAEQAFRQRGLHKLEALAALRRASVEIALGDLPEARDILRHVDAGPAGQDPAVRTLSAVMATRVGRPLGDDAAVERLLATLRTDPAKPPLLLKEGTGSNALPLARRAAQRALVEQAELLATKGATPIRWADVGFLVTPDGKVSDVEVLRGSRAMNWTKPVVELVASRRYAPVDLPPGQPGLYRVERFTLRATRSVPLGSLIKAATGPVTLEVLDLTRAEATAPAA